MRKIKPLAALLFCLSLFAFAAADDVKDDNARTQPRPDNELIQGSWKVVSMVRNGEATPGDELQDNPMSMRFEGKTLMLAKGDSKSEAAFSLDPSRNPRQITITPKDGARKGQARTSIYELKGDTLKIAFRLGDDMETPPADFAHADGVRVVTLERQKPEAGT